MNRGQLVSHLIKHQSHSGPRRLVRPFPAMPLPPVNPAQESQLLAGMNILIAGAASEIGSAVAQCISACGAHAIMLDRREHDMAVVYDAIKASHGSEPLLVEFNLAKAEDAGFHHLSSALAAECRMLHGFVQCTHFGAPLTPIRHLQADSWGKFLDVQLIRPMRLMQALLPLLQQAPSSSSIFTVLECGDHPRAYWGAQGTVYAATINMMKTLSAEHGDAGLRFNTLDCGKVSTALRRQAYPAENQSKLLPPDDPKILNYFLYLLSDHSQGITAEHHRICPPDAAAGSVYGE